MAENDSKAPVKGEKDAVHVDEVLAVSRHSDGTPAQTPGFKSVDPEFTTRVSENQLREQAVSAVDDKIRRERLKADAPEVVLDPATQELKDAHEAAAKSARSPEKF